MVGENARSAGAGRERFSDERAAVQARRGIVRGALAVRFCIRVNRGI